MRAVGIHTGLVANNLQANYPLLQRRIIQIGHSRLDGIVEPLQAQFRFCGPSFQLIDVLLAPFGLFRAAAENAAEEVLKPFRIKQPIFNMVDDHGVELVHRDRSAFTTCLALSGLDGTGIVAVASAFAGADGHRPSAVAAIADAGQQGRPYDHASRHFGLGVARL
nr:hypothetical protein [Shinella daejeonensis]